MTVPREPRTPEDWTGWNFSTCNLKGHPSEPHWHPPVGETPQQRDADRERLERQLEIERTNMALLADEAARLRAALAARPDTGERRLDVERLARALQQDGVLEGWDWNDQQPEGWRHRQLAEHVAAEYDRLGADSEPPGDGAAHEHGKQGMTWKAEPASAYVGRCVECGKAVDISYSLAPTIEGGAIRPGGGVAE